MMETIATEKLTDERGLLQDWIHRWGCSVSEVALDPSCQIFRVPDIEGFIAYRIESGCAVVYGDPICAPENIPHLAQAFANFCSEQQLRFVYIIVTEPFASWAINHLGKVMVEIGEELIFDPFVDPMEGHKGFRLRNKSRHVRNLGFEAKEYLLYDEQLEHSMKQVGVEWLKKRRGPQIYLGHLNFFDFRTNKRWFYVQQGKHVMGTALLTKMEARNGWLLKFLVTIPGAPRGTSEYLMMTILETLRKENCHFLTCGMVPAEQINYTVGLGKFSVWIAQQFFKIAKWLFNLHQRKTYWEKFHPKSERVYLLFSQENLGIKEIRAVMRALKIDFLKK